MRRPLPTLVVLVALLPLLPPPLSGTSTSSTSSSSSSSVRGGNGSSRKLLQQLGFARQRNINRLNNLAVQRGIDESVDGLTLGQAGTLGFNVLGATFGANGLFGGGTKSFDQFTSESDRRSASATSASDVKSISGLAVGATTARAGSDTLAFLQQALQPASERAAGGAGGASSSTRSGSWDGRSAAGGTGTAAGSGGASNSTASGAGNSTASNSTTGNSTAGSGGAGNSTANGTSSAGGNSTSGSPGPAPAPTPPSTREFSVLLAAGLDYAISGDTSVVTFRDYSLSRRSTRGGGQGALDFYGLDYDYGTWVRPPQTSTSLTRQSAHVDREAGRSSVRGSSGTAVTAPASTARTHTTVSALQGVVGVRRADDLFATALPSSRRVITPPVPLRSAGADAATTSTAKSFKGSGVPSFLVASSSAGAALGGHDGAESSVAVSGAGIQAVSLRGQTVALGSCLGLDTC